MYSPDSATVDPRNYFVQDQLQYRYQLFQCTAGRVYMLDENSLDILKGYVANHTGWLGNELFIRSIELESGDEACVESFEYNEDNNKYEVV